MHSTSFEKLKSTVGLYQFPTKPPPTPARPVFGLAAPLPLLCSDPVADSWFGGTGGGNVGTLSVTIGQALSRGHGASPLTLERSGWGQPRGGSFLPSPGCRFLMCPLLARAPGDCPEGRDSRLFPPSRTKWCMLFLFKQGAVVKCPDSAHTKAQQRLQ